MGVNSCEKKRRINNVRFRSPSGDKLNLKFEEGDYIGDDGFRPLAGIS